MSVSIVVPLSGGKDSQACLKLAMSVYKPEEVRGVFIDTKFEHPDTYAHIDNMAHKFNVTIDKLETEGVESLISRYNRFPNIHNRFCTKSLKILTMNLYLKNLAVANEDGFEVWYGMRQSESAQRAVRYAGRVSGETYLPSDILNSPKYLDKLGVVVRLPIVDWTTDEVLDYIGEFKNPLYTNGFDRVGCFPCLISGKSNIDKCLSYDGFGHEQRIKLENLQLKVDGFKPAEKDTECSFCSI